MLTHIHPKLPMRDNPTTKVFYVEKLGFQVRSDYGNYLLLTKDHIEIHFFEFRDLVPGENYGQVYIRTDDIASLYQTLIASKVPIHPNGALQQKPWGQWEFALLDPDNNLLTFGQDA